MVKFRKSAVNAGSRDQQVAIVGIFSETVFTVFRFKARNGYDKISRSKARALYYSLLALMVQRGEIAEGKKLLTTIGGMGSVVSSPIGVWGGAPEADAILSI